jgi:MFS family permease
MTRLPASPLATHAPSPDSVDEVAGPPFTPSESAAAIAIGLLALLISGLMGLLLATLVQEGRLTAPGIGLTAMLEALSTGLVTGPGLDLATLRASGAGVMAVRALAGLPEGILLWISIGFISRTATPERWAAVLFTGMGATQLAVATGLSALVLPRYGANGGYVAVAVGAALAFPVAFFLPSRLGAVAAEGAQTSGMPPLRGWIALAGTLCMAASLTAVSVYVIPLARQAGLSVGVGRTAVSVALGCQMLGGVLATALAGRLRYVTVFWACAAVFAATWGAYALHAPAWLFIAMTGLAGAAAFVAGPFLVPMTVEADPSRRTAMQSGAVQLLAGAFGPLLAAFAVSERNVHGVLILAAALQAAGLALASLLHRHAQAERVRLRVPAAPGR